MKFFLFKKEDVNEFSVGFTNTGDNLSVLAVPAESVAHMTATPGYVHFTFNNAGLYDHFQGTAREGFSKTKVSVACSEGEEYDLIREVIAFISNSDNKKTTMVFDAVTGQSTFKSAAIHADDAVTPFLPKQPTIMSTQAISNDPASIDLTQTTTTTIADIAFTSPTLMPILDYNEDSLTSAVGQPVGSSHAWNNAGTGGATYHIDNDTGTPTHVRAGTTDSELRTDAVSIAAGEDLIMANEITIQDDYTMYMVIGLIGYGSLGSAIIDDGLVHIGFADASGNENTDSQFWIRHKTSSTRRPAYMQLNNTAYNTASYTYPDPKLEAGTSVDEVGQTCYIFMLRRDKDYNLFLHNHTGVIVGYVPRKMGGGEFATDGDLTFDRICTGFRGNIARFGVIPSDIGAAESSRICQDLFDKYHIRY
jgi:hypothetical protein